MQQTKSELREFSVVYTDRALNLMSNPFQKTMRDVSGVLKRAYHARSAIIVPGSGTFAMEAVARQFATGKDVLVVRNGFFSFRWSAIFEEGNIPSSSFVLKAQPTSTEHNPQFQPPPLDQALAAIREKKPAVVFAPHVETSTGIILPNEYIKTISDATHSVGGLFVVDAIASGTVWLNMQELGIDILVTAPQKGWSGPACCGIVMLNETAYQRTLSTNSTSFSLNLRKWLEVMEKYENGSFMYYTTLPTDAIVAFRDSAVETEALGFQAAQDALLLLGKRVRQELKNRGFKSVAAEGYEAPGVVVVYSPHADMVSRFSGSGLQIAAGVPFKVDEPEGLITFRIGLFGLEKIKDIDGTVSTLTKALDGILSKL